MRPGPRRRARTARALAAAGLGACLLGPGACGAPPGPKSPAEGWPRVVGGAGIGYPIPQGGRAVDEIPSAPEQPAGDSWEQEARINLQLLRARSVESTLSGNARVAVARGPHTFGVPLSIGFEVFNPMGVPVRLPAPPEGLRVELQWQIERWQALGGRESQADSRVARLAAGIDLPAGARFREETRLPLGVAGDPSALWKVSVGARLRLDGLELDGQPLPVKELSFQPARFLVLPEGWKSLSAEPLANLRRVLTLASPEVDRHVLICAALLAPGDEPAALEALMEAVQHPVTPQRALTAVAALSWLTGEDLGPDAGAWKLWWERRKMEPTHGPERP